MTGAEPASGSVSLLDEIRSEVVTRSGRCIVGDFLANHPDIAAAVGAAVHEGIPKSAIYRFLAKKAFAGRQDSTNRHFRGDCSCPTS